MMQSDLSGKRQAPGQEAEDSAVYLLHFEKPYQHARHYLGSTNHLKRRLAEHANGQGARLMEVISAAGIRFQVARTWTGGKALERQLKRQHNAPRLCPVCQAGR